jgi:hypothetical protein
MVCITFLSALISLQNLEATDCTNSRTSSARSVLPANTKSFSHVTGRCCNFLKNNNNLVNEIMDFNDLVNEKPCMMVELALAKTF